MRDLALGASRLLTFGHHCVPAYRRLPEAAYPLRHLNGIVSWVRRPQ